MEKHEENKVYGKQQNERVKKLQELVILGLAVGDSLGSTSEFYIPKDVEKLVEEFKVEGWPRKQVGGGMMRWKRGQPTDDTEMAMCILRSFSSQGKFECEDITRQFITWISSGPRDAGATTRKTLSNAKKCIENKESYLGGGHADFK